MTTVAIIGAGEIGAATAHALAAGRHAGKVTLLDAAANVAAGKALDIQQAGAISGHHTRFEGTADMTRVVGCSVCVIAEPFEARSESESPGLLMRQLLGLMGAAPIVFAGTTQAALFSAAVELKVPPRRLIGSAPEALASSVTAIVAMEANCAPSDVMLTVLGAPPGGLVVPWSEASIGGYALQDVLPQVTLARIEARLKALWPPGPYALGASAARAAMAVLRSSRRHLSITTQLQGEFGIRNRPGVVSARLGPGGIHAIRAPELTTRERVLVQTALGG